MSTQSNQSPSLAWAYICKSLAVARMCMWVIFCLCTFFGIVDYSLDLKNRGGLEVRYAYATISMYYAVAWFLLFSAVDKILKPIIKARTSKEA